MAKNNDREETFVLTDDNGEETYYRYLKTVEYKGKKYAVLESQNDEDYFDDEEEGGVCIILQVKTNKKGEKEYYGVGDEAILDAVFDIFLAEVEKEEK
ncbi:MAG: DUF1292 domain-containing protein [Eubacterium sp.]|nr:DUF1292 domain-containing protein [Eubacterium sp.]MBR3276836.1 DUF1292 domain-containing protein [Eubacterium sp.]